MKITRNKQGGALVTVMIVMMVMAIALGGIVTVATQRAFTAKRLTHQARALAVAEAGANQAYALLSTNFAARYDESAFPATAYGGGEYDVAIKPIGQKLAIITSTGAWGIAKATVILDVRDYGGSGSGVDFDWPAELTNIAILCGGSLTFGGCGTLTVASGRALFHANGRMDLNGCSQVDLDLESSDLISIANNSHADGDIAAPSIGFRADKVILDGVVSTQAVPLVTIPQIDLTPYYNIANRNGQVMSGSISMSSSTNIAGGILWINGDVLMSSHAVINGTVIATGNIHVSGQVDMHASQYKFVLVSRDGNIQNTSTGTIEGLAYARSGGYEQTANGVFIGQIVVAGNVKKGGCSDVIVVNTVVPPDPDPAPWQIAGDYPVVSAWQK